MPTNEYNEQILTASRQDWYDGRQRQFQSFDTFQRWVCLPDYSQEWSRGQGDVSR